ncbi:hypothetical protein ABTB07_21825, partial [Acinetobacter baumannii]
MAQARNPFHHEICGPMDSGLVASRRPGMTTRVCGYTAILRCRTGAPAETLSAASMMALAS